MINKRTLLIMVALTMCVITGCGQNRSSESIERQLQDKEINDERKDGRKLEKREESQEEEEEEGGGEGEYNREQEQQEENKEYVKMTKEVYTLSQDHHNNNVEEEKEQVKGNNLKETVIVENEKSQEKDLLNDIHVPLQDSTSSNENSESALHNNDEDVEFKLEIESNNSIDIPSHDNSIPNNDTITNLATSNKTDTSIFGNEITNSTTSNKTIDSTLSNNESNDSTPSDESTGSTLSNNDANESTSSNNEGNDSTPSNETEDDIVTFEEFKSRMASQDTPPNMLQGAPAVITHQGNNNNFASHECGAKIVDTNPETKSAWAILTDNKDQYMLNPCSADIWFVIELCELVSVTKFEIGSFELFSSIPESFVFYTSESFPSSNWEKIKSFSMQNERGIQDFPLPQPVYAKYIKIVMLSHFGSEHYCPVSMIRVYGTTMMEEYENSQRKQSINGEENNNEGDANIKDGTEGPTHNNKQWGKGEGNLLLAAAKDVIFDVIGKAVNGLIGNENNPSSLDKESYSSTDPISSSLPPTSHTISISSVASNDNTQPPYSSSSEIITSSSIDNTLSQYNTDDSNDLSTHIPLGPTNTLSTITSIHTNNEFSVTSSLSSPLPTNIPSIQHNEDSTITSQAMTATITTNSGEEKDTLIMSDTQQQRQSMDTSYDDNHIVTSDNITTNTPNTTLIHNDTNTTSTSTNTESINGTLMNNITTTTTNSNNNSNNISQFNNASSTGTSEEIVNSNGGPRSEKSVFLRLSNRINNLELNMSLFGSYLDQISTSLKRSKNRTDDMQKSLERRMSSLNSTIQTQVQLNGPLVKELSASIVQLTQMVNILQEDKNTMLEFVLLFVLCVTCFQFLLLLCCFSFMIQHYRTHTALQSAIGNLRKDLSLMINHTKLSNGHVTTKEDHMTVRSDHVTNKSEKVTTRGDHLTTRSDLVTTRGGHMLTKSDHMTTTTTTTMINNGEINNGEITTTNRQDQMLAETLSDTCLLPCYQFINHHHTCHQTSTDKLEEWQKVKKKRKAFPLKKES